jgi:hypothetical protein
LMCSSWLRKPAWGKGFGVAMGSLILESLDDTSFAGGMPRRLLKTAGVTANSDIAVPSRWPRIFT